MLFARVQLQALLLSTHYFLSLGFVPNLSHETNPPTRRPPFLSCFRSTNSRRTVLYESTIPARDVVYVVRWEGCLADTVAWRIRQGMDVAAAAWPELIDAWDGEDQVWLVNKLSALSHVLVPMQDDASIACEFALATRLLLEEQELDQGRSNGMNGKYARLFHPQRKVGTSSNSDTKSTRTRNGRPLTVGEIAANWYEGGMIRDTLRVKYSCNGNDPIPLLQEIIDTLVDTGRSADYTVPIIDSEIASLIRSCRNPLIVTVNHASDLPFVMASLELSMIPHRIISDAHEAMQHFDGVAVTLITDQTIQDIIQVSPANCTVMVLESFWTSLRQFIPLFGDYIPRRENSGRCIVPEKYLSLNLASWARNSHPTQHAAAVMNPWTDVITRTKLVELLQEGGEVAATTSTPFSQSLPEHGKNTHPIEGDGFQ